jgi:tRNA(fMet)-specific endonuclease VapC
LDFFAQVRILDFDEAANIRYVTLRQQRMRIGTQDLCIAAIVLALLGSWSLVMPGISDKYPD